MRTAFFNRLHIHVAPNQCDITRERRPLEPNEYGHLSEKSNYRLYLRSSDRQNFELTILAIATKQEEARATIYYVLSRFMKVALKKSEQ